MYDPKIGRFLTMDPIVQAPLSGQSWNPYSYVFNNPLSYVDPSGFEGDKPPIMPIGSTEKVNPDGSMDVTITYPPRQPPKADPKESGEQVGAFVPPVDVSTLGSSSGLVAQPANAAPEDWKQQPIVQVQYGIAGGFVLGLIPFGGVGQQLLDAFGVLPHGTPEARLGLAVGQIVGGAVSALGGLAGEVGGGIASASGFGAVVGVPAIVVSTTAVVGGIGNMAAGVRGLATLGSGRGPRNGHLAEKAHPKTGVPFDEKGYPDFKAAGVVRGEVKITPTGSRPRDFAAANRAAGYKATPEGYTWHHHQDGTTMQLVPTEIHQATGHTGGFSVGNGR